MKQNRMYNEFACYWPLLTDPAEYEIEGRRWREVLRDKLGPGRHPILDLGSGGGNNLSHLVNDFDATAVDVSASMLEHSKRLNPGVVHIVGDMRDIRLGRKFKAFLVHDAISYITTEADLRAVMETAKSHLDAGGVFLTTPDYFRETFKGPLISTRTRSDGKTTLTCFTYTWDPDPRDATIEVRILFFILGDGRLRIEEDLHMLGLFRLSTFEELMKKAGFRVETLPYQTRDGSQGAYLLVGTLENDQSSRSPG